MALSKIQPASIDLTANYAFTGTNSVAGLEYAEKKLTTVTASSSATLDFTSNIDSTYNIYKFRFIDLHPETDNKNFTFNGSSDGGSNYNVTKTTTLFSAFHSEADDNTGVTYAGSLDTAQGTGHQVITWQVGNDNDHPINGCLLYTSPSPRDAHESRMPSSA